MMLKQYWSHVIPIIVNQMNSYHQTYHEILWKFVYGYSIDEHCKCIWFYQKMSVIIKFYASNHYRTGIWLHIFKAVECINRHLNKLEPFPKTKNIKKLIFFRNVTAFYYFFIMFLCFSMSVFEKNWKAVLIHVDTLNCMKKCNHRMILYYFDT